MNRTSAWIALAALASFAAGANVGVLLPRVVAAGHAETLPEHQQYVRDLAERYGLSTAQQRSLQLVMQSLREAEIEVLTSTETAELPEETRRKLLALRSQTSQRIRALLDDQQRARYDDERKLDPDRLPDAHAPPAAATRR